MQPYRITLEPESAFGTLLKGDTLFGQLCWTIVNRHGVSQLEELLSDYQTQPFAVCSDGFPHEHIPRPALPLRFFTMPDQHDRKAVKQKRWVPVNAVGKPVAQWLGDARSDADLSGNDNRKEQPYNNIGNRELAHTHSWTYSKEQPHNTINRLTGTTGEEMFAPYTQSQIWYQSAVKFDVYLLVDESRLSLSEVKTLISDIGTFGYGRDASIGLGKFKLLDCTVWERDAVSAPNAGLTLAPCAPQGLGLDNEYSYYNVFTRFGRHGDMGVHGRHGPFKAPVLLADAGAVFAPVSADQDYIGQALGGSGELSRSIPETVHQGYAPFIPIHLPECNGEKTA